MKPQNANKKNGSVIDSIVKYLQIYDGTDDLRSGS